MAPRAAKRPRVSKSNTNDHEMSSSQSFNETVKRSHEYKINGYILTKGMGVGECITNGKFIVSGYDWVIVFYPDGHTQADEEYVSLFIKLVSPGEVRAVFEFKLLEQRKGEYVVHISSIPKTFSAVNPTWYVRYFQVLMVLELCWIL
ncbi:hypothetical protein MKX01_018611 [Papaver californicum]|nr:hypothetical protein MKX01_018611 [Papaver californicum]